MLLGRSQLIWGKRVSPNQNEKNHAHTTTMKTSKLDESLELLMKKNYKLTKLEQSGNYLVEHSQFHLNNPWIFSPRELIKFAQGFGKESKQKTAIKKSTKAESRRERSFVRDRLKTQRPEEVDTNFPRQKFSDTWNWD